MALRKTALLLIAVFVGLFVYPLAKQFWFGPDYRLGEMRIAENGSQAFVLVDEDQWLRTSWSPLAPVQHRLAWTRIVVLDRSGIVSSVEAAPAGKADSDIKILFGLGDRLLIFERHGIDQDPRIYRVTPEAIELVVDPDSGDDKELAELYARTEEIGWHGLGDLLSDTTDASQWRAVYDSMLDSAIPAGVELLDGAIKLSPGQGARGSHEIVATWKESGKREVIASDTTIAPRPPRGSQ
jgi:hypothetical protein